MRLIVAGAAGAAIACFVWRRRRSSEPPLLTAEDVAAGLKVMHPVHGYRHLVESDTGLVQPFDFDLDAVAHLRAFFELREHDIVVATYPKCGTTWMQQLVLLLLRGPEATCNPMRDAPWLEMSVSSAANGAKSSSPPMSVDELSAAPATNAGRRVWKTHAPERHAPWKDASELGGGRAAARFGAKVIVVVRNSKDAAVSLLHHTANIPPFGWRGGWPEFAPLFLSGRVESNSYWDWYQGWWHAAQANASTVLWVTFEEMTVDLPAVAAKVAEHLGVDADAEALTAVCQRCGFSSMKAEADRRDAAAAAAGGFVKKDHIRKGQVGSWRTTFREADVAEFDKRNAQMYASCPGMRLVEG